MKNVTIDFESFWDRPNKYSLSCMSTEDYVGHALFEVNGVSAMIDDGPVEWFSGTMDETAEWLDKWDIPNSAITAHHARLEATILEMRFGIRPKFIFCTEYMANPSLKPFMTSLGLKALLEYFELPPKGDGLIETEGLRREEFSPALMERHAGYGCNDTQQTRALFKKLRPRLSADECRVLDLIVRMYSEPQFEGDLQALRLGLSNAQARKVKMMSELEVQGVTKKILGSGEQFAQLLRDRGVEPPMKISPSWLKKGSPEVDKKGRPLVVPVMTYAFGKQDPEFMQLKEDMADDEEVTALLNARTETMSTIEEDRCTRYIQKIQQHGMFRCPVVYASTHTQRLGGDEKENVLNAPNVDRQKDGSYKSHLRFGFAAPKGNKVVAIDYSQVEARISAYFAGQEDVLQAFREDRDLYSEFASKYTGRAVSKTLAQVDPQADKDRKLGKETILGGWFGLGGVTFQRRARGKGLRLTLEEAKGAIAFFREDCYMAPRKWADFDNAIARVYQYRDPVMVDHARFEWDEEHENTLTISLANGTKLYYPDLTGTADRKGRMKFTFRRARDKWRQNLWGGVVMNNRAQATAGILIRRAMVDVKRELGYRPALQVYDECLWIVPDAEAEDFKREASALMTREWEYMPGLPIAVEAKIGQSYGEV